jgi:hypothetical protein
VPGVLLTRGVQASMDMKTKISVFCGELEDGELARLADDSGMTEVLERARSAIAAGDIGTQLEADLDALDVFLRGSRSLGMYPPVTRGFRPLPGVAGSTGAQWWTCPRHWCAGRGRVRPQQPAPICAVTGQIAIPRSMPS